MVEPIQQQQERPPEKLPVEIVALSVAMKKNYYDACLRNGFFMPHINCSLCTMDYMQKIKDKVYWTPKVEVLKFRNCPRPPTKEVILNYLLPAAERNQFNLGIAFEPKEHLPDIKWALTVLATLDPNCVIFNKDYTPPLKPMEEEAQLMVDNRDVSETLLE